MAGAADALQPARDGLRRLDLHDEVDRAHVDAELERRRRDEARDLALLQQLLDLDALLARYRAVVGAGDLFLGQVVEPEGEPLGEAAVVDEDDRRAVRADELEDLGVDRGPDRLLLLGLAHVVDGTTTVRSSSFARPASTSSIVAAAGDEAADLLERPLRRRQPDALDSGCPRCRTAVEPLDAQREVRAALRAGHGVHLVDDQRADRAQDLARARRQQQEQRLGGRDQDVRRLAQHRRALLLRRVAGADRRRAAPSRGRRAARAGSARCRSRAPSAARRRAGAAPAPAPRRAGRSRRGRPRASSPSRSAPGSACARRSRSPASRAPARGVGSAKAASNQARVVAEKTASGSLIAAGPPGRSGTSPRRSAAASPPGAGTASPASGRPHSEASRACAGVGARSRAADSSA